MDPEIITLDNDLRVASFSMPNMETVSLCVHVNVGSRCEERELSGMSHFLEHMLFKGTEKRSAYDIAVQFDDIGGAINAYTSREHTVFYARTLTEYAQNSVDLLSDILINSLFDAEEIEREKGVVLQEINQTIDTPDEYVFDIHNEVAYADQPLGRSILGESSIVQGYSRDQIVDFKDAFYCGQGMVVSVVGNLGDSNIINHISDSFSRIGRRELPSMVGGQYTGGIRMISRELEQVHLVIGFKSFSYHDSKNYAQQLLSIILGGGMSSRLFQEVREKRGLAYNISCFASTYNDSGKFVISSSTDKSKIKELIKVTCNEIKRAMESISEAELQRARIQIKSSLLMSKENGLALAEDLARHISVYGRYISSQEIIDKIEKITVDELRLILGEIIASDLSITAIGDVDGDDYLEFTRNCL